MRVSVWEIKSKPFNGPYRDDVHFGTFNTGRLRNPFQTAKVNFFIHASEENNLKIFSNFLLDSKL